MAHRTREFIKNGATTIYEATFVHDDILVIVDILHKGSAGWELYEVEVVPQVKDVNLNDLSVQCYVLTGAGLDVSKASLVHMSNEFVDRVKDLELVFTIEELTCEAIGRQNFVRAELAKLRDSLGSDCPDVKIGLHCLTSRRSCDYISHCWKDPPY